MQTSVAIVLKPLSHPALGDIRMQKLIAIGRAVQPFATYPREIIVDLSRRHARIFCANGGVYLTDLGSKNGTTVNRTNVRARPHALQEGDEICFGGGLSYRVALGEPSNLPGHASSALAVTFTPVRSDLQPIVISRFPFMIGKTVEAFSRYRQERAAQLHFLSRRHAHVFLKDGLPFIEDLGSTNGTFVGGKRLDEQAVSLADGALLEFGGNDFAYRVHLENAPHAGRTTTGLAAEVTTAPPVATAAKEPVHLDRTTFVAAASSFLEIFCADHAKAQHDDGAIEDVKPSDVVVQAFDRVRQRGKFAIFLSELRQAFAGSESNANRRNFQLAASGAIAVASIVLALYLWGASERELKDLVVSGAYAKAATLASERLERDPDNAQLKALATEALLKAQVPEWLNKLKAQDFAAASAILAGMKQLGRHNRELDSLLVGLGWTGDLERLVVGRGGADAPIRIYSDEETIRAILKRWDDDPQGHQRALARIASHVREFKGIYGEALTHLRKLQSDSRVYLAAIDRLKTAINAALNRDAPEALQTILQEYSEKYPRLGLDSVRQDLRQYIEIDSQVRARSLSRLVSLQSEARFVTPPFAAKYHALQSSDRFPPVDVIQQYVAVSKAWREGDAKQAFFFLKEAASQAEAGGTPIARRGVGDPAVRPWSDAAARELAHKKSIIKQFSALQRSRGGSGYNERLLAFHGVLDPSEDSYFMQAIEADVGLYKDKAIARAQELLNRAEARWHLYRANGLIEGRQRLEAGISDRFRTQALLLSQAYELSQKGTRIYTQLHLDHSAQWNTIHAEIKAEEALQRTSLLELRNVLEPGLLKAKLALLGGRSDEKRKSI